jgi:hypothetical protein
VPAAAPAGSVGALRRGHAPGFTVGLAGSSRRGVVPQVRDGDALHGLAIYGDLTTEQMAAWYYPGVSLKRVQNRLCDLQGAAPGRGFVVRRAWPEGLTLARRGRPASGWRITPRGLRWLRFLPVPRACALQSPAHDATVAGVARYVLAELHRKGRPEAVWLTERELLWGRLLPLLPVPSPTATVSGRLPHGRWEGLGVRPDGLVVVPEQRVATEIDLSQHGGQDLGQKVTAYRELLGYDPATSLLQRVQWFCLPGGALAVVERAIACHGDPAVMTVRPLPAATPVYR